MVYKHGQRVIYCPVRAGNEAARELFDEHVLPALEKLPSRNPRPASSGNDADSRTLSGSEVGTLS